MKYNVVEIRPYLRNGNNRWYTAFSEIDGDRVDEHLEPSALGHYYYPRHIDKQEAFNRLKKRMIVAHEEKIESLTKSLEGLKMLDCKCK